MSYWAIIIKYLLITIYVDIIVPSTIEIKSHFLQHVYILKTWTGF